MKHLLIRLAMTLAMVALLSAQAHALVANDPAFYCEQTGGEWSDCASGCEPLTCENPVADPEMACPAVCTEGCNCPSDKPLWAEMVGCISEADCAGGEDPAPPGMSLCEGSGGTWDWCGSGCGPMGCGDDPADFEACDDVCREQCACPDETPLWDDEDGCISESDCVDSPQKTLCDETAGAWSECGSGCGPLTCDTPTRDTDQACPAVCVELCECPADRPLWHETLGCIAEATCESASVDGDLDGYPEGDDCDDTNAGIYPGAVEICNGADDNCDGTVDEGCDLQDTKNLCASSGGAWTDCVSSCGPYACDHLPTEGESCVAVCVEGCQCPEDAPLWDIALGCIAETDCEGGGSGSGSGGGTDGDSGGCAGGPTSTPLIGLALLAFACVTRRRLTLEG